MSDIRVIIAVKYMGPRSSSSSSGGEREVGRSKQGKTKKSIRNRHINKGLQAVAQEAVGLTMGELGVLLSSIFRFLPLGAGSSGVIGVLVMVIVRLTTCFTQIGSLPEAVADLGDSHHLRFESYVGQSAGENADRSVLLLGESLTGDQTGDCGIVSLGRTPLGVRRERAEAGGRIV